MRQETYTQRLSCHSAAAKCRAFRVNFPADRQGPQKDIEFAALDAAPALLIVQQEASNRAAELWCDGHRLCTIVRTDYGLWEISV